jgi:hypothetical protein
MGGCIRGDKSLIPLIGRDPIIVIPYIKNQNDLNKERKDKKTMIFLIICFILVLTFIISVHFLYQPLYLLWSKFLLKF